VAILAAGLQTRRSVARASSLRATIGFAIQVAPPPRPNFEYLKKRAKEALRELQKKNPRAKLAEAQHAIAREHGFLNWSQLKEAVDAVARRAEMPPSAATAGLFPRFTMRAKQATFFSRFEAGQFGHAAIDPEHLLLGVMRGHAGLL
jgi:hypothetical protein